MSIDDVEHDYIAHRSLDTLNAFNDKLGFRAYQQVNRMISHQQMGF